MRSPIRLLPILLVLLALTACGFHLRGGLKLATSLDPMFLTGVAPGDPLFADLRRGLAEAGIHITGDPNVAHSWLKIDDNRFTQNVLGVDARGKVVEFELVRTLRFSVLDRQRRLLVAPDRLVLRRSFVDPETTVLGKHSELDRLREAMRQDLVRRLLERLQAVGR